MERLHCVSLDWRTRGTPWGEIAEHCASGEMAWVALGGMSMYGWWIGTYVVGWGLAAWAWNRCFMLGVLSCDVSCSVALAVSIVNID